MTYMILCKNKSRIASIENTEEYLKELKNQMYLDLFLTDINGNKFYNVFGFKKNKKEVE